MLLIVFFSWLLHQNFLAKKYFLPLFPIFLNAKKNLSMFEENVGGFQVKKNPCI